MTRDPYARQRAYLTALNKARWASGLCANGHPLVQHAKQRRCRICHRLYVRHWKRFGPIRAVATR